MILQALAGYYDRLAESGKLQRPGWQKAKVSYALELGLDGSLRHVLPLLIEVTRGKKKALAPQELNAPSPEKRSVGIVSNFLCDNATYLLGLDAKGKPERAVKCFEACKALHLDLLSDVDCPEAQAIVRFFEGWDPLTAPENPVLHPYLAELVSGVNLILSVDGRYAQDIPEIQAAWDRCYASRAGGEVMRCLVTGEAVPAARLHPSIKGVAGGQATGTSLVSFNAPAYESFGRDGGQGMNAPVGERAAFAYGAALNYMIAEPKHHMRLSDTTVVFWADSGEDAYAEACCAMLGEDAGLDEKDLYDMLRSLANGLKTAWSTSELNPEERFYILGVAPNAGRLSVRFFLQNTFGAFARNLYAHQQRLEIVKPGFDTRASLSFWQLLNETVNKKSRDKTPSPLLSGALVRAVLTGAPYPMLLLDQTELRIRAEQEVTRGRAAIIKAFMLRNTKDSDRFANYEEALSVQLNENTTYLPYLLGRLFSVLEALQQAANPGITATTRDRYFNSACATPAVVFPQLIKLAQAHLKKLGSGGEVYYSKQIGEIVSKINATYPPRLDLYDQGIFQLGYYHQVQARFTKKEEKENV